MQPILVISRHPAMVEVAQGLTSDGRRIVILEPDWRRAIKLAGRLLPAFILVDAAEGLDSDVLELVRQLWAKTGRPILFLGAGDTATAALMPAAVEAYDAMADGWTEMVSDDIAVSKRQAMTGRDWEALIHRAPQRHG